MTDAAGGAPKLGTARAPQVPIAVFASLLEPVTAESDTEHVAEVAASTATAEPVRTEDAEQATESSPAAEVAKKRGASKPKAAQPKVEPAAPHVPAKATRAVAAEETHSIANKGVQVSLPKSLEERLQQYRRTTGLSNPQILFTALETVQERLPELVQPAVPQPSTARVLFNRPPVIVRHQEDTEPRSTFMIKISPENKAVLDSLAEEVGAPSRNAMLIAAYDAFLPNK